MGFVEACGAASMGYWERQDLPFYYSLASHFPIGDRYFSSVMAQTYPNRRFLIAATALGNIATNGSGISHTDAPNGTIFDRLDNHGISWKDYYPDAPTCGLFLPNFLDNQTDGKVVHFEQFLADAKSGSLPSFSIIDPYVNFSEEDGDISIGEAYAATMINALLESPNWEHSALILNYDEHGGWYDHVPPRPAVRPDNVPPEITVPPDQPGSYDYTGFRVPCVVVSPWGKKDFVSHVVYDHTSVLKLVETKWNLPAMTYRDANAENMLDFFDFSAGAGRWPNHRRSPRRSTRSSVRRHRDRRTRPSSTRSPPRCRAPGPPREPNSPSRPRTRLRSSAGTAGRRWPEQKSAVRARLRRWERRSGPGGRRGV